MPFFRCRTLPQSDPEILVGLFQAFFEIFIFRDFVTVYFLERSARRLNLQHAVGYLLSFHSCQSHFVEQP